MRRKEKVVVPRMELSEEYREELDRKFAKVQKNDMVTVIYFCQDEYLKKTGKVSKIEESSKILKIVNTKIHFEDIYDIIVEKSAGESSAGKDIQARWRMRD